MTFCDWIASSLALLAMTGKGFTLFAMIGDGWLCFWFSVIARSVATKQSRNGRCGFAMTVGEGDGFGV
jgi:hypothetical protein